MTFVRETAGAAAAPSARRADIVRGWADLPLFTTVFAHQRQELPEISTPVIRLWERIVAALGMFGGTGRLSPAGARGTGP